MFDRLSRRFYYTHTSVLQLTARRIFYTLTEVGIVADENVNIDELAEKLIRDMSQYTDDVVKKSEKAAKAVRNQMKPMVEEKSPVRAYSTHTQVVKRIIVHRVPGVTSAVKQVKEDKYQPGYFKQGWDYGKIKLKNGREIYGVRNKNMPTVTHLLNFDRNLITHGQFRRIVKGTGFVDEVQDWGTRELERRLSEFLNKE